MQLFKSQKHICLLYTLGQIKGHISNGVFITVKELSYMHTNWMLTTKYVLCIIYLTISGIFSTLQLLAYEMLFKQC